jgi:hypothetical protein
MLGWLSLSCVGPQVGNSGLLINASHGEAIDAHEAVWRMNLAFTHGHERDVGTRTTLQMTNSNWFSTCVPVPLKRNAPEQLYCAPVSRGPTSRHCDCLLPNGKHVALLVRQPGVSALRLSIAKKLYPSTLILKLPLQHHLLSHSVVREYAKLRLASAMPEAYTNRTLWPEDARATTGLQAIVMSLALCDRVSELRIPPAVGKLALQREEQTSTLI